MSTHSVYAITGTIAGILVAYFFLREKKDDTQHVSTLTMSSPPEASPTQSEPQAEKETNAEHPMKKEEKEGSPAAAQSAQVEKPAEHEAASATAQEGSAFNRLTHWSQWGPNSEPYLISNTTGVDGCETMCEQDENCASSTYIGGTCGLFAQNEAATQGGYVGGEEVLGATTSIKTNSDTGGKVCHGPVLLKNKHERPKSVPCHLSEQEAVDHMLKDSHAFQIFSSSYVGGSNFRKF
jgi:hypothetical protein